MSSEAWKLIKSDKDVPVAFLKQQVRFQTPCAVGVYGYKSLRERYEIPSNIVDKFLVGKISRRFVKVFLILRLKTFRLKLFVHKKRFCSAPWRFVGKVRQNVLLTLSLSFTQD